MSKDDPKPYDAAAEYFGERAAIREYEGGLSRKEAERLAELDLAAWLEGEAADAVVQR